MKNISPRDKIKNQLEIQEKVEGRVENKELILMILDACETVNQFNAFCDVYPVKYGALYYEYHCFYKVKASVMALFKRAGEFVKV